MSEDVFGNKFDEMSGDLVEAVEENFQEGSEMSESFEADKISEQSGENEELNPKNSALEQDSAMQDRAKILADFSPENENKILAVIKNESLSESEISSLVNLGKKDITIALARSQKLNAAEIEALLPNAPYMAVKMLIEHQDIAAVRDKILAKISARGELYKEMIADYKGGKW
ncbi:hypothetical protein [Campylobacter curvus]|uniref:hypothetical protein n=1 Tax=Campylobacter curvus TaxID=200 RepID=UPI0003781FA0|nr:hypothetical protein [Campylobacter curvus]QKF60792.1 hypothetical protein CCVT_0479 [Campylobacter curvus]UEB49114.1 hypothetical protein LK426_05650 [Campylobacter curvus]